MSPITIDELTSEVIPRPPGEREPARSPPSSPWEPLERLRAAQEQLESDRARTRAEGFDA